MDSKLKLSVKEEYVQPKVLETANLKEITKIEGIIDLTTVTNKQNVSCGDDD